MYFSRFPMWLRAAILAAITVLPTSRAQAQDLDAGELAERLRVGIEAAVTAGEDAGLRQMLTLGERALVAFPKDALLNHYVGYAHYRIGMAQFDADPMGAIAALEQSELYLAASIDVEPIAESHALMTSVLGGQIMSDESAMQLGPRIGSEQFRASALGPDNPRVKLMEGLGAFHTPSTFGGGFDIALDHLLVAAELFEDDAAQPPWPTWGHAETYAWMGQTYVELGMLDEARDAYEKALVVDPDYVWVRDGLLPALGRP